MKPLENKPPGWVHPKVPSYHCHLTWEGVGVDRYGTFEVGLITKSLFEPVNNDLIWLSKKIIPEKYKKIPHYLEVYIGEEKEITVWKLVTLLEIDNDDTGDEGIYPNDLSEGFLYQYVGNDKGNVENYFLVHIREATEADPASNEVVGVANPAIIKLNNVNNDLFKDGRNDRQRVHCEIIKEIFNRESTIDVIPHIDKKSKLKVELHSKIFNSRKENDNSCSAIQSLLFHGKREERYLSFIVLDLLGGYFFIKEFGQGEATFKWVPPRNLSNQDRWIIENHFWENENISDPDLTDKLTKLPDSHYSDAYKKYNKERIEEFKDKFGSTNNFLMESCFSALLEIDGLAEIVNEEWLAASIESLSSKNQEGGYVYTRALQMDFINEYLLPKSPIYAQLPKHPPFLHSKTQKVWDEKINNCYIDVINRDNWAGLSWLNSITSVAYKASEIESEWELGKGMELSFRNDLFVRPLSFKPKWKYYPEQSNIVGVATLGRFKLGDEVTDEEVVKSAFPRSSI